MGERERNPKNSLRRYLNTDAPAFTFESAGQDHDRQWVARLALPLMSGSENLVVEGRAPNKKEAERLCGLAALEAFESRRYKPGPLRSVPAASTPAPQQQQQQQQRQSSSSSSAVPSGADHARRLLKGTFGAAWLCLPDYERTGGSAWRAVLQLPLPKKKPSKDDESSDSDDDEAGPEAALVSGEGGSKREAEAAAIMAAVAFVRECGLEPGRPAPPSALLSAGPGAAPPSASAPSGPGPEAGRRSRGGTEDDANWKSMLSALFLKRRAGPPAYERIALPGSRAWSIRVAVPWDSRIQGEGVGASRKEAEKAAAKSCCLALQAAGQMGAQDIQMNSSKKGEAHVSMPLHIELYPQHARAIEALLTAVRAEPPPPPPPPPGSAPAPAPIGGRPVQDPLDAPTSLRTTPAEALQSVAMRESHRRKVESDPRYRSFLDQRRRLPVWAYRDEIARLVDASRVVVVCGETGSGKTTQVPQFVFDRWIEEGRGASCRIVVTQPRRISAISVAERIAAERGEGRCGQSVGYQIRLESVMPTTPGFVLFCTTGILLRRMQSDKSLTASQGGVTHVIVDEIHERDLNSDVLLIVLRDLLRLREDLRVVLMSATLDPERFADYFAPVCGARPPLFSIPGNLHPVQELFLEDVAAATRYVAPPPGTSRDSFGRPLRRGRPSGPGGEEDDGVLDFDYDLLEHVVWYIHTERPCEGGREAEMTRSHREREEARRRERDRDRDGDERRGRKRERSSERKRSRSREREKDRSKERDREKDKDREKEKDKEKDRDRRRDESSDRRESDGDRKRESEREGGSSSRRRQRWDVAGDDGALGGILVFLPGWDQISKAQERLRVSRRLDAASLRVVPLHSSLNSADQQLIFERMPPGVRKVVLATNIAETSITVDDVVYVVDFGRHKEKSHDVVRKMAQLQATWISKASARQRAGRAGRVRPGMCYRLYPRQRYERFAPNDTPEILRTPLEELVLLVHALGFGPGGAGALLAKALEPPSGDAVRAALYRLRDLGAVTLRARRPPAASPPPALPKLKRESSRSPDRKPKREGRSRSRSPDREIKREESSRSPDRKAKREGRSRSRSPRRGDGKRARSRSGSPEDRKRRRRSRSSERRPRPSPSPSPPPAEYVEPLAGELEEELTALGRHLAHLPLDPALGKALIYGSIFGCLDTVLTIAAGLGNRDPFICPPPEKRPAAEECKRRFAAGTGSDAIGMQRAFEAYEAAKASGTEGQFAYDNFLSHSVLRSMGSLRTQFLSLLAEIGYHSSAASAPLPLTKASLAGGFSSKLAETSSESADPVPKAVPPFNPNTYSSAASVVRGVIVACLFPSVAEIVPPTGGKGSRGYKFRTRDWSGSGFGAVCKAAVHPSSVLANDRETSELARHRWLVYHEKIRTSQIFLRTCTLATPLQLVLFGGPLYLYPRPGAPPNANAVLQIGPDSWVSFTCSWETGQLLYALRSAVDGLAERQVQKPTLHTSAIDQHILQLVALLLEAEAVTSTAASWYGGGGAYAGAASASAFGWPAGPSGGGGGGGVMVPVRGQY